MENMNITNAQYHAIEGVNTSIKATIDGVEYSIPCVLENIHYAEIMRQVDAGTLTIADAD